MKNMELLFDRILTILEKINPDLYRKISYDGYKKYSEFINNLKYKDKYFFIGVILEISTYCNRKCRYCPNVSNETPKEFMSWEIFEHAVEELQKIKFTGLISYSLFNEPLFDDRLIDFIQYVHKKIPECKQTLVSNGDILNVDNAKELANAGIDKFIVTVHDEKPERNLERLKPVKKILGGKMKLQSSNQLYLNNRGGAVDVSNEKRKTIYKKCQDIRHLVIRKNGDIVLCCQDYFSKYVMGNIMKQNILEIWNSYKIIREKLLKDNVADLPICKICLERDDK